MAITGGIRVVLFDVFGTLVTYQPDRMRLGAPQSHRLVTSWGWRQSHAEFVARWDESSRQLEDRSRETRREFSMSDAAAAFARDAGLELTDDQCHQLGATFVREWQHHVVPVDGVAAMIERLRRTWTVGVVSNTHDRLMVPSILGGMGLGGLAPVVLSIEHGWCKPHPSIYRAALLDNEASPQEAVFVGDDPVADFEGPEAVGLRAYLIDPLGATAVPEDRRLASVLDIESKLIELAGD